MRIIREVYHDYPTEEQLAFIQEYPTYISDWHLLMSYVQLLWWGGKDYCYRTDNTWTLITCGWSGNEEIIAALQRNYVFWMVYWKQSNRGGKYIFEPLNKESEE